MAATPVANLSSSMKHVAVTYPVLLVSILLVLSLVFNRFKRGLRNIPGPPLAAYTGLWRLYDVAKGQSHATASQMHEKYGPVVRIGPNHVSIGDPAMIPIIYGIKESFTKTAFYPIQSMSWKKRPVLNLFSTRDPEYNRVEKRKVGAAYSFPSLLQSEAAVDSCVDLFMHRLGNFASRGESVDLGDWLEYFAFDVVGELTFASKMGFMEQGRDLDAMMEGNRGFLAYAAVAGQIPAIHKVLLGNPLLARLMPSMETWNPVLLFTLKVLNGRAAAKRGGHSTKADGEAHDMLGRWEKVQSTDPLELTLRDMVLHVSTNIFAGVDTTSIALRAIVYHLCRHPECMDRLVAEIDTADGEGGGLSHPISYREATTVLPYLGAVIKEAMRLHPSVGMLLERHVPAEGLSVEGYKIPAGTVVGINPWVTNRSPAFGSDPDRFNPDRWLTADEERLKQMDNLWEFTFGAGSRKCLGRNMAMIEIHKVIPELLRRYHVELTHPEKDWSVSNYWFMFQKGLICNLKRR